MPKPPPIHPSTAMTQAPSRTSSHEMLVELYISQVYPPNYYHRYVSQIPHIRLRLEHLRLTQEPFARIYQDDAVKAMLAAYDALPGSTKKPRKMQRALDLNCYQKEKVVWEMIQPEDKHRRQDFPGKHPNTSMADKIKRLALKNSGVEVEIEAVADAIANKLGVKDENDPYALEDEISDDGQAAVEGVRVHVKGADVRNNKSAMAGLFAAGASKEARPTHFAQVLALAANDRIASTKPSTLSGRKTPPHLRNTPRYATAPLNSTETCTKPALQTTRHNVLKVSRDSVACTSTSTSPSPKLQPAVEFPESKASAGTRKLVPDVDAIKRIFAHNIGFQHERADTGGVDIKKPAEDEWVW